MQTFLTHRKHLATARALDMMRLGKQRAEARQILSALLGETEAYFHHPATQMWKGYEGGLVYYGLIICHHWTERGFKDTLLDYFHAKAGELGKRGQMTDYTQSPPWLNDLWLLRSHRSNLIRKMPHHYADLFPNTPENMPYLWPVNDDLGGYSLRLSGPDLERVERGERKLPPELRLEGEWVEIDE